MNEIDPKPEVAHDEDLQKMKNQMVQLKSNYDELGLFKTAIKFRKAVFICTLICIAAAADGYQYTLNGNIIANTGFVNQFGFPNAAGVNTLNAKYTALWGAMQSLGQLVGMVFLNPLSDRIGRKYTLYLLWLILFGSIMTESFATDWKQWAGAKLLAGMGVGCIQATLPIYVTEWSPVNIRGAMICAYGVWNQFGTFLAPLILYIVQQTKPLEFRIPIYTQWAFLGIMLPIFIWLPESPSYYAAKDEDERGKATLRRVNGNIHDYNVEEEYAIIKNIIVEERIRKAELGLETQGFRDILRSYIACFKGPNARRTLGSALPACAQQLTGLAFLNVYASLFFKQSGFSNAFLITLIITAIKVLAIFLLVVTTDRLGRRNTVLATSIIGTAMMLLIGILGQFKSTTPLQNLLIFAACLWSFGNAILGALGWTFVGEVAAQRLRARTAGIAAGSSVLFGLTFNTSLPVILDVNGVNWGYNTAWLFFATGVIVIVLMFYYLPETARRNPAELDELYEKGVPAWRMASYVTDVQNGKHLRHEQEAYM